MNKTARLIITGKVQGVGFRAFVRNRSMKNNVTGWVRNLHDGRVEILIEGEDKYVNSVIKWCSFGPANSRVDSIQITDEYYSGDFQNFEVRY